MPGPVPMLACVRTVSDPPLTLGAWLRHDAIQDHVSTHQPQSVIEFGCGMGSMGARLAQGRQYVGVEPDEVSRAIAMERLPNSAEVLPHWDLLGDRTAELVAAFEVLEHIEDDIGALRAWRRHVRPGGTILLSVPAFMAQFGPSDEMAGHYRRYEPDAAPRLLSEAGFEPIEVRITGFPLGHVLERARHTVAARRNAGDESTIDDRTAASGRLWQPDRSGPATRYATAPFRRIQSRGWSRGIGLVISARNPLE